MTTDAQAMTALIRDRIERHIIVGPTQWYIDQHCIDCDADEFWRVVERVVQDVLDGAR